MASIRRNFRLNYKAVPRPTFFRFSKPLRPHSFSRGYLRISTMRLRRTIARTFQKPRLSFGKAAILAFLAVWDMYLEPLVFINNIEKFILPLSLANFNDLYGLPQWHLQLAATTLSVVPVILVYLIFQKKITDAMVTLVLNDMGGRIYREIVFVNERYHL